LNLPASRRRPQWARAAPQKRGARERRRAARSPAAARARRAARSVASFCFVRYTWNPGLTRGNRARAARTRLSSVQRPRRAVPGGGTDRAARCATMDWNTHLFLWHTEHMDEHYGAVWAYGGDGVGVVVVETLIVPDVAPDVAPVFHPGFPSRAPRETVAADDALRRSRCLRRAAVRTWRAPTRAAGALAGWSSAAAEYRASRACTRRQRARPRRVPRRPRCWAALRRSPAAQRRAPRAQPPSWRPPPRLIGPVAGRRAAAAHAKAHAGRCGGHAAWGALRRRQRRAATHTAARQPWRRPPGRMRAAFAPRTRRSSGCDATRLVKGPT
jgi:hypothetical protein